MQNNPNYYAFCGELCGVFSREWDKMQNVFDTCWKHLEHIPEDAWMPMTRLAANAWDSWPRNFVKSVKEVYALWAVEVKFERTAQACGYCGGVGYFSGTKYVEVKPGIKMGYRFTWRCNACRNWYGKIGTDIPAAYPLEVETHGFGLDIYSKPLSLAEPAIDIKGIGLWETINSVGHRVNPKQPRPDFQRYPDD